MSLTTFVEEPEAIARLKPLLPTLPRTLPVPLQVESRTGNFARAGTAFDYLLRFELQRREPHARTWPWVAEVALDLLKRSGLIFLSGFETTSPSEEIIRRASEVVENAKAAVSAYVARKRVSFQDKENVAFHALRLAGLDPYRRARRLDPQFDEVNPNDVRDLIDMLAIVPFSSLVDQRVLLLNPVFGESSRLVGGADADLIAGTTLIDVKTRRRAVWTSQDFRQLLGYVILARNERRARRAAPLLNRIAMYFSRHGHLWTYDAASLVRTKAFREVERWFLMRAEARSAGRR